MTSNRLNVGVIGLGVGLHHAKTVTDHPYSRLYAVCDLDSKKLEQLRETSNGFIITSNADDILEDPNIDAVVIASFDDVHAKQTLKALEHEKHVFVEKPLCLLRSEAEILAKVLERKGHLKLSSNMVLRTFERFLHIRNELSDGAPGEVYLVEGDYLYGRLEKILTGWRGQAENYSVILGGGIHLIDLLLWLMGERVVEVSSFESKKATKAHGLKFADCCVSLLHFASGSLGKVSANFACVHPHFHNLRLFHSAYTFENRPEGLYQWKSKEKDAVAHPLIVDNRATRSAILASFLDEAAGQGTSLVSKQEVFDALAICFAVQESAQLKRARRVEYFKLDV